MEGGSSATADEGDRGLSCRVAIGLTLFAAALRVPTLSLRHLVEGDGVHYAQLARSILAADFSGLANPYWSNLWPGVIAATSGLTGLGVVASGRLASLVSGVLLVPVAAVLATRLFGSTTGWVTGMLCAGHPWLIHFSTLVFSESFFALTVMALLLVALGAPTVRAAVGTGVLGGLAVVTRPEAYAVVAVVLLWLARSETRPRRRDFPVRSGIVAALVVSFVLGRALLVHRYHGLWDLGVGTKGTANLFVGLSRSDREMEQVATAMRPDGRSVLAESASQVTLAGFALAHPALIAGHVGRNLVRLAASATRVFPLVPLAGGRRPRWDGVWPALVILSAIGGSGLALLGLVWACRDPGVRPRALVLLATGTLYVLGLAPLYVHDRLVLAMVPVFLIFLAHGLTRSARVLLGAERRVCWSLATILLVVGPLSLASLLRAPVLDYAGDPVVQRETGEWLAARYPQDTRIMTAAVSVGFYFYDVAHHASRESRLPWGNVDEVLDIARRQDVRLLVIPEWHLRAVDHPAASTLLHPDASPGALRHVVTLGEEATGRMFVYEIRPLASPAPRP